MMNKLTRLCCALTAGTLFPLLAFAHPGHGPENPLAHAALHSGWIISATVLAIAITAVVSRVRQTQRRQVIHRRRQR
jgi:hypothetical protein